MTQEQIDEKGEGIKTTDVTPTWSGLVEVLMHALESPTLPEENRSIARAEIRRMAKVADRYNEMVRDGAYRVGGMTKHKTLRVQEMADAITRD